MVRWLIAIGYAPLRAYYAYCRSADRRILWPACKRAAAKCGHDIDAARAAFALHAFNDRAWMILGEEKIRDQIDRLT